MLHILYSAQGSTEPGRTSRLMDTYNRHYQQQQQVTSSRVQWHSLSCYPQAIQFPMWNFRQTVANMVSFYAEKVRKNLKLSLILILKFFQIPYTSGNLEDINFMDFVLILLFMKFSSSSFSSIRMHSIGRSEPQKLWSQNYFQIYHLWNIRHANIVAYTVFSRACFSFCIVDSIISYYFTGGCSDQCFNPSGAARSSSAKTDGRSTSGIVVLFLYWWLLFHLMHTVILVVPIIKTFWKENNCGRKQRW